MTKKERIKKKNYIEKSLWEEVYLTVLKLQETSDVEESGDLVYHIERTWRALQTITGDKCTS